MFLFLILGLLITNISCHEKICVNSEGCPEIHFTKSQKWCTVTSEEYQECRRLINYASSLGFSIACVERYSKESCLEAIRRHTADIVAVVNLPVGEDLTEIITTTTLTNPVDLTAFKDSKCVFKMNYEPDERIESSYLISDTWKCTHKFIKVLCDKKNPPQCNYMNEIIMRKDDPNILFVTIFLINLYGDSKFFRFIFQGYTNDFYGMSNEVADTTQTRTAIFNAEFLIILAVFLVWIGVWVAVFLLKKKYCKK